MSQTESDMEDEHINLNDRNTQEALNLEGLRAANDRNAANNEGNIDRTDVIRATARNATIDYRNPIAGTSQSFGNHMPGTSQSFGNPIAGTSQSFRNPMPGTSQSFGNPMPGASQSFGNPMPGTNQSFGNPMPGTSQMLDGCGDVGNEKKKTKDGKSKKKKQKKKKKAKVPNEANDTEDLTHKSETEVKDECNPTDEGPNRARRLEPLDLPKPPTNVESARSAPEPQYGGCFGFIRTWLAKRKEKRREKKRQAIRARFSNSLKAKLAEHSHRKARGGVSFVIEISNRPTSLSKPVLPPIKRQAGPIRPGVDEKLLKAEIKRQEELNKRTRFVQLQEERRFENIERKFDNERGFQQKAALTIIAKQGQAKRNVSRMETERRCASVMRRAASRAVSRATSRIARALSDDSLNDFYLE